MEKILIITLIYFGVILLIIEDNRYNLPFLNPLRNYETWTKINWFGIWVITILLNIIFIPYAIIYWVCKLFRFMLTVGRK